MPNQEIGMALKELRQHAEKTQQWAADQLGLKNKSTLASWEGGKAEPDILTFLRLCCLYGVSEADKLADKIGIKDTAGWDFGPVALELTAESSPAPCYAFCPYCGKRLPREGTSQE